MDRANHMVRTQPRNTDRNPQAFVRARYTGRVKVSRRYSQVRIKSGISRTRVIRARMVFTQSSRSEWVLKA